MIARDDLPGATRSAVIEENEVLDEIKESLLSEHSVQQTLGVNPGRTLLCVSLPFDEVLPLTRNRAIAGAVAVADYQERVVMERMPDAALV